MAETEGSIDFDFAEIDSKEFEFHLQHHGVEQPNNITGQDRLRQRGVVLCGRLVEAAHGWMKGDGLTEVHTDSKFEPCTLVVFEWYVHTADPDQRIKFARIDIIFSSCEKNGFGDCDPWVVQCAPGGAYSLFKTTKTVEKSKGWHPTLKVGQDGLISAESAFVYDLKETIVQNEQIYVDGCSLPPKNGAYFHPDKFSAVRWNIFENAGQKSGIPRYFRTAVLLNRNEDKEGKFLAEVETKVKVSTLEDAKERIRCFLGRDTKDDLLVFNPILPPKTNRFRGKLGSLGSDSVNLDDEMGFLLFKDELTD